MDQTDLGNGKNEYGQGSWASSIRYHGGTYYVSTFSNTTGKTSIFSTKDIEKGPWTTVSMKRGLHNHSLFFDDDGRTYMVYGGGTIRLVELASDASDIKPVGAEQVIIENASGPAGSNVGLGAEGSQLFKWSGT